MIFHVQSKESLNFPVFLSMCVGGPIICFHCLPSELQVMLMFTTEISFMDKQTNFARFEFNMWDILAFTPNRIHGRFNSILNH